MERDEFKDKWAKVHKQFEEYKYKHENPDEREKVLLESAEKEKLALKDRITDLE